MDGKRHGIGNRFFVIGFNKTKNGRIYYGNWIHGIKHGQGTETLANNCQYTGEYQGGLPHGYGTFTWSNKETYKGEWCNGSKHGTGEWKS